MASDFIGRHVSINCGSLGYFQGQIKAVNTVNQTLCIENCYKNGIQCDFPEVTLLSQDIIDLTLIDNLPCVANKGLNTNKLPAEDEKKFINSKEAIPKPINSGSQPRQFPSKQCFSGDSGNAYLQSPPKLTHSFRELRRSNLRDGKGENYSAATRFGAYRNQDECFNVDCNEFTEDFDFEKNLALFDKQALYDEVYSGSEGEIRTPVKSKRNKPPTKYRHDENVLESQPTVYRQIVITSSMKSEVTEYYTDTGLVIPCINYDLHQKICNTAANMGISFTRQIEVFGLNTSQMALNLLGGSNRLHPRNAHQCPHVIVFAGPHQVGAQSIATARHLASQNVELEVFLANFVKMNDNLQEELKLLSLTTAILINDVKDISNSPVDLVIMAIDDDESAFLRAQMWYNSVTSWCKKSLAPILCLCPPDQKNIRPIVEARWSVCSVLPRSLSPSYGSIYLIDLGLPPKVFKKLDIKYRSPFCSKPYIALHTKAGSFH